MSLDLFNRGEVIGAARLVEKRNPVNCVLINAHIRFRAKGNNAKFLLGLALRICGLAIGMIRAIVLAAAKVIRKNRSFPFAC